MIKPGDIVLLNTAQGDPNDCRRECLVISLTGGLCTVEILYPSSLRFTGPILLFTPLPNGALPSSWGACPWRPDSNMTRRKR